MQLFVLLILIPQYTPGFYNSKLADAAIDELPSTYVDQTIANPNLSVATPDTYSLENNAATTGLSQDINSENADVLNINNLRNSKAKASYVRSACLTGIARSYAKALALYQNDKVHNAQLGSQTATNCTTNYTYVAENIMAQDTESHAFHLMTNITVAPVAAVACGDRSTILDARVPPNPACSAYPSGYPYGFKYVGVGAYKNGGKVYIVQDFAGCNSTCRNLPAPLGQGSIYPNQLRLGQTLHLGDKIESGSGPYLILQNDGNLVAFAAGGTPVWATGTNGKGATHATFQTDGNLVIFTANNGVLWASSTNGKGADHVIIQKDANVVIANSGGGALWSWKTGLIAPSGCINPTGGLSLRLDRTDRGVDYYTGTSQAVRAICSGVIQSLHVPGWPGDSAYIQYKLTSYPAGHPELLGKCIYMAEYLNNMQKSIGQSVNAGDVLAYIHGDTEWGWSASPGVPSSPKALNDGPTDAGNAFARLTLLLGGQVRDNPGSGALFAGTSC
ncbi:MAG TPA: hypothetical protein VLF90_02490 [Patescibacteria group bacterium]|nr:hypothetical protein [Patescibacteria group bacterium]